MQRERVRVVASVIGWAAAVIAVLVLFQAGAPGTSPLLLAAGIAGILAVGATVLATALVRPELLVTVAPLLVVPVSLGWTRATLLLNALLAMAYVGGALRAPVQRVVWSWLPVVPALGLLVAEALDLSGSLHPNSPWGMATMALLGWAAATVAPPNPTALLWLIALLGTGFSLVAATSNEFRAASRSAEIMGTNANGIGLIAIAGLVAAATIVVLDRPRLRLAAVPLAIGCVVGAAVSNSQGALLAGVAGVGAVAWLRRRWVAPLIVGAAAVGAVVLLSATFVTMLGGELRDSAALALSRDYRLSLLAASWDVILQSPWTGVSRAEMLLSIRENPVPQTPHNTVVAIAMHAGVPVLLALLGAILAVLVCRGRWEHRRLMLPLLITFATLSLTAQVHDTTFALLPAIALGVLAGAARTRPAPSEPAPVRPVRRVMTAARLP